MDLHMPPASIGAWSGYDGEDCGRTVVAQGIDGVGKESAARASMSS